MVMKQLNGSNLHLSLLNYNCKDIRTFQGDIWKLWAVSGNLTIRSGNYTLDSGDSSGPFHVDLHVNKSYSTMACVKYLLHCYMEIGPGMILWGLCHVIIVT